MYCLRRVSDWPALPPLSAAPGEKHANEEQEQVELDE